MESLPKESKGVLTHEDKTLSYGSVALPELTENSVLVKIHSAPINPSDQSYIRGVYPAAKAKPTIAGFEGSGLIVATGDSDAAKALQDKKVCFFAKSSIGSWGQYTVLTAQEVFPLPGNLSYEQGACALVNPLTVQGFIHTCQKEGFTSIVHSAAASSLGKLLVALCKKENITLINVVRREGQVETLKSLGAEHIVNTGEENWKESLSALIKEHKSQAYFDPIGGDIASTIFNLMPPKSTTYNYGGLSFKPFIIRPTDLIFHLKVLTGWWLTDYVKDYEVAKEIITKGLTNLATGVFTTVIHKKFPHDKYEEALKTYAENMSKGKVLLQNPDF